MSQPARSTLPPQASFYHAILRHLAGRPEGDRREAVHEAMPELLKLSEAQRNERLANLKQIRYRHRSGFALSMLKRAGYVESPARGIWKITDRGRDLLRLHPDGFSQRVGQQVSREHASEKGTTNEAPADAASASTIEQTPEERIEAAVNEINESAAEELLNKILAAPPAFFESLVLDLLHALGYGANEDDLQRIGGPGDEGFDGVISLDKLGFEKIYVQAKRWQGSVGRPQLQAFFGALSGRRARKGVFLTTSTFTREARDFGAQIAESVILIDGERLTKLMIEQGVGVTHRMLRLPHVDSEYFEAE